MEGKHIQLQMGFIALRCRTPSEVKKGVSREAAMEAEASLFGSHPLLSQLPDESRGLNSLVRKIFSVQADRVEAFIPEIKQLLNAKLLKEVAELGQLAPKCADDVARASRVNISSGRLISSCTISSQALGTLNRTSSISPLSGLTTRSRLATKCARARLISSLLSTTQSLA